MSNPPPLPEKSSPVTSQATGKPLLGDCWSCRVLSGGGLLASGGYVGMQAQKVMRLELNSAGKWISRARFEDHWSRWTRIYGHSGSDDVCCSLAAWGLVVMFDPVGKKTRIA